jgi:succinate-semialdehyde dehydrogenase/glutarate-semialdehyde dehydrogenase
MKIGNGMEPGVMQGPLIDKAAVDKVEEHISDALAKGAKVLTGGKRHALGGTCSDNRGGLPPFSRTLP